MAEDFNYMRAYNELLRNTEVPPRFIAWTAVAGLLAALEARVYINQGVYVVRPNFFMVLVAGSGLKKSTAINLPSKLINQMSNKPRVISQKITPEALVQNLKEAQVAEGKHIRTKSGGIIIADELATFLDRNALEKGLGPMLTALYDCNPFEYTTISRGVERIENSYLSILGGTTVELLRNSLPKDAIGGGFTSRTMFIYEDQRPRPVAWVDFDAGLKAKEARLVQHLEELMTLEGEIQVTPDAKELFIEIYNWRYDRIGETPGLAQYENRRHANLLKVAMAIMVSEKPKLVLERHHIFGANELLRESEAYLPRVMELLVASESGHATNLVNNLIQKRGEITRADLMRSFASQYDAAELTKILETLIHSNQIKPDTLDGKLIYRAVRANK